MTYLTGFTTLVENKVKPVLPQTFSVGLDGWSTGSTHYVAILTVFPSKTLDSFIDLLIEMIPIGEEISKTTEEHIEFLEFVLGVFAFCCPHR